MKSGLKAIFTSPAKRRMWAGVASLSKKAKLTPAATTQMLEAEAVKEEAKAEEAQAQEAKAEKATADEATAAVKTGTKKAAKLSLEASVKAALGSTEKERTVGPT